MRKIRSRFTLKSLIKLPWLFRSFFCAASLPTVFVLFLNSASSVRGEDDPGTVYPQPAYTADQFVDFIGLSADPFSKNAGAKGPYPGLDTRYPPALLFDLGVRHYRAILKNDDSLPDSPARARAAYAQYGAKPMLLMDPHKSGTPEQAVQLLKDFGGSEVVGELEGPNEVNNKFPPQDLNLKYAGKTDEAAGAAFQVDYNKALKADPETKDIPFVAYTAIFTDYRLARPCDAYDDSNMHSYQGYGVPSSSLLSNFISANHLLPVGGVIKPFVPTECGYNVGQDVSNHIAGTGNLHAQAINIPMLFGEYFRHGFIKRAYLFALLNTDGYGLMESDQVTKRPSYYALQSFIAALKDSTWNPTTRKWEGGQFKPKALLFTVDGAPKTLKSVTLQKENGEYSLLIWNELPNWNSQAKQAINNPPASITLNFQTPVDSTAQVLRQDDSGAFKPAEQLTIQNGGTSLDVPSSVVIVQIKPAAAVDTAAVASPANLTANATENSVSLSWTPAAGSTPSGYFVYRNGWCVASTTDTSFADKSPWIRPGLGYTYKVQAYDKNGNMSEPATQIVQTAAKFPDFVLTDFGLTKPDAKPGDMVQFRAKIKNIGEGALPSGGYVSVSFGLDGKAMAYGGVGKLDPGEEVECVATGGHFNWTAEAGTHLLSTLIDDQNRIPEEKDKINNVQDKTIVVGTSGQGEILGASQEAPAQVNLTSEGTEDWVQWGLNDAKTVNRKAKVSEIGNITTAGKGFMSSTSGFAVRSVWSDGSPTASMNGTNSSLWLNGIGNGYSFTAPADNTERVLKIYAGGINGVSCSLTASLSDNSAPAYLSKTWTGNCGQGNWAPVPGDFSAVYTIRYRAASAGQTLKIEYTLNNEPNRFAGQARLGAATLAPAASP